MNQFLEKFIDSVFGKPGKALDLGAGLFLDVKGLKQKGWKCEGVDLNTGVDLEFPYWSENAPFDLVFSNYVLQKLKNKKQFVKTAFENLRKNSWLFIHTFDKSDKTGSSDITQESLKEILIDAGFKNIKARLIDYFDDEPGHNHWHKILEVTAQKG